MSANFGNHDISTSGSITADGSVGIGTASPSCRLDVSGVGRFVHADGDCGLIVEDTGGSGIHIGDCAFYGDTYAGIKHSSHTGSEYMMISQGDHTFISAASGSPVIIRGGANNAKCEIRVYDNNDGQNGVVINEGGFDRDTRIEGAGDQNLFKVDASADSVGIGTASPSYKLEVNGDIGLTDSGFYASPTGVMVGTSGWLYNDGQTTISHGSFSDNGDAQNSIYVLRGSTTNATFTTIQNNGSNVVLASNRTMMFTANIVGRSTNSADNAAYKLEGVLYNDGYGASIIGTPVKTIIGETDSSWDVQATISGAGAGGSDYLNIQVKGATSKNVNWVAKLEILEVGGDITGYTEANILRIDSSIVP